MVLLETLGSIKLRLQSPENVRATCVATTEHAPRNHKRQRLETNWRLPLMHSSWWITGNAEVSIRSWELHAPPARITLAST